MAAVTVKKPGAEGSDGDGDARCSGPGLVTVRKVCIASGGASCWVRSCSPIWVPASGIDSSSLRCA